MECFGDVSGHFRGLIQHDCDVVVVGVVFGDSIAASRCPKKIVRKVDDIKEAKWHDLTEVQKRRIIECLSDNDVLTFGYSKFTAEMLHALECHYLLHQNVEFPTAWDLALTGYAYGEILFEYGAQDEQRVIFYPDRVASVSQAEEMVDHTADFADLTQVSISASHNKGGIQAADCFAGAIAEDYKNGTSWLDEFDDDDVIETTAAAIAQLEADLVQFDKRQARR